MTAPRKIILKKLKELDTVWHPESTLVFKSQQEKLVTGRYVEGEFIPFDDEALELCTKWSFKYDTSLVDDDEEDDEDNEEDKNQDTPSEDNEEETVEDKKDTESQNEEETENKEIEGSQQDWINNFLVQEGKINDFTKFMTDLNTLSKNLNDYYKSVSENLASKVLLSQNEANDLKNQLEKKSLEYDEIKAERDMLKSKFEGFKNFFLS